MNPSKLYRLDWNDVLRGLVSAIAGAVVVAVAGVIHGVFGAPDLNVFAINWGVLGAQIVNVSIVAAEGAFTGYIVKNFLSNEEGNIPTPFGTIKLK